jgi:hypothetical protein
LLDMPDLLLYFQKIMAERGLTYKVGFTGRLRWKRGIIYCFLTASLVEMCALA